MRQTLKNSQPLYNIPQFRKSADSANLALKYRQGFGSIKQNKMTTTHSAPFKIVAIIIGLYLTISIFTALINLI